MRWVQINVYFSLDAWYSPHVTGDLTELLVSITIADALASCGPSPSSAMLLTIYNEWLLDFHVEEFW